MPLGLKSTNQRSLVWLSLKDLSETTLALELKDNCTALEAHIALPKVCSHTWKRTRSKATEMHTNYCSKLRANLKIWPLTYAFIRRRRLQQISCPLQISANDRGTAAHRIPDHNTGMWRIASSPNRVERSHGKSLTPVVWMLAHGINCRHNEQHLSIVWLHFAEWVYGTKFKRKHRLADWA